MGHTNYNTDCAYYTIIHTNLEMWTYSSRSIEYIYRVIIMSAVFFVENLFKTFSSTKSFSNKFDTTFPGMKKFNTRQI